jgi:hypothetical protein
LIGLIAGGDRVEQAQVRSGKIRQVFAAPVVGFTPQLSQGENHVEII